MNENRNSEERKREDAGGGNERILEGSYYGVGDYACSGFIDCDTAFFLQKGQRNI
jgi:hypothetical protein